MRAGGPERPGLDRKVLIVSYYFPPSGGPGVQRVLKFTKYLPAFGWRPLVLTVREDADFPVLDPTLAAEIPPEATIYRSGILEFYDLYRKLTGKARGSSIDIETVQREGGGWRNRLTRSVRGSLFIPDGRVGWYPQAVALGRRIIAEERPDAIFASGPPFTTHWIGKTLSEGSGIPLVLDFRDPWTRATFYPTRPAWARRLDERLEAACVRTAVRLVSVNREIRDEILSRQGGEPDRWSVIPNGYDPTDFDALDRREPPDGLAQIAHIGSLFASRIPWTFLDVFEEWMRADPERSRAVRLVFAGRLAPEMEQRLQAPGLEPFVDVRGYLSHAESLRAMSRASLLLLLTGEDATSRGMLTGKIFEYLGSGAPILALAPEGEAAELLTATGAGTSIPPGDAAGQRRFLDSWWASWRGGEVRTRGRNEEEIARYSRPAQAAALAALLGEPADRDGSDASPHRLLD